LKNISFIFSKSMTVNIPEVRETSIPLCDRKCQEWKAHCERMSERWEQVVTDDQCSR